jgi:hypothetical protein
MFEDILQELAGAMLKMFLPDGTQPLDTRFKSNLVDRAGQYHYHAHLFIP